MFQLSGLAHKKYQFKEYLLASLFFLISATIAISIANITLFYNIYQSSHNFFNLVVMSRHPLSYFAYGVCGWFLICYVFALCYKGIKGNLLRVFLRFGFGAYLVISILLLIYYVLNYNVAFETFTLFDSFKLVISDNPGFLLMNLGLLIFFILDRQINLRKRASNKKKALIGD